MSIHHVVRCDECRVEKAMTASVSSQQWVSQSYNYAVPSDWKKIDTRHFCTWTCVGKYGEKQAAKPEPRP